MPDLPYPEVVGSLGPQESRMFSQPFRHDFRPLRAQGRLVGCEGIHLFGEYSDETINLPSAYDAFLPAIAIAASHEKSIRQERPLTSAVLTIRQYRVRAGESQQDINRIGGAHRDNNKPDLFYTVCDANPTEYYPHIDSTVGGPDSIALPSEDLQRGISFQPYEVVCSSSMTYHRSPPVDYEKVRTFLRLAFTYSHA